MISESALIPLLLATVPEILPGFVREPAEEHRLPVSSLKEPVSENLKQNVTLAASSDSGNNFTPAVPHPADRQDGQDISVL